MCGIAGILSPKSIDQVILRRMLAAMRHRGPDDEGMVHGAWCMGHDKSETRNPQSEIWLGMRRLAIIDIPGGHQPMFNEDGTVAIVFNGEIYNFQDLRRELERRGHRFRTRSDTEVIVHAYEEWGSGCLDHLRGMFAFAILDQRDTRDKGTRREGDILRQGDKETGGWGDKKQGGSSPGHLVSPSPCLPLSPSPCLFLARDRLGIKPLYYYQDNGVFLFASEVRALLASGLVPFRLNVDALYSYLLLGSVQEPLTLIEGIYSLPPAHWMYLEIGAAVGGRPSAVPHRYWDLPSPSEEQGRKGAEVLEGVQRLLEDAVGMRLIADVPLGAFLSGGIDSGAVVALMGKMGDGRPKTFTVAFEEKAFDESDVARVTARRFETDHTEVNVTAVQVLAELPQALAAMDQPTMDGINTYYVSRAAKEAGLTVALSGLGGDEVFAGYSTFRTVPRLQALRSALQLIPGPIRRATTSPFSLISFFPSSLVSFLPSSDQLRKLSALVGDPSNTHPYFLARALFTPGQVEALLTPQARERLNPNTPWHRRVQETLEKARAYDPINAVSYLECSHYLLSTLLRDTDQVSMAHSLEVRVPLIDHKLVEFMMRVPGEWKMENGRWGMEIRNPKSTP